MGDLETDRVYRETTDAADVAVASSLGLVTVAVSGAQIGRFRLAHRDPLRDVTTVDGTVIGATADDICRYGDGSAESLRFPSPTAVGRIEDAILGGDSDGRVARTTDGEWRELGTLPSAPAALDGHLVATEAGVFRHNDGKYSSAGLEAVRDVADATVPYAATAAGLYRLGNGWMRVADGTWSAVAVRESDSPWAGWVHAGGPDGLVSTDGSDVVRHPRPADEPVVDVAAVPGDEPAIIALTEPGTLAVGTPDYLDETTTDSPDALHWTTQHLGVGEGRALAIR